MDEGPLEAYQWSVAKVAQQDQWVKRMWIAVGAALLVLFVSIAVWSVATIESQFHTSNGHLQCDSQALHQILTELARAQQATERHQMAPQFTFPTPC